MKRVLLFLFWRRTMKVQKNESQIHEGSKMSKCRFGILISQILLNYCFKSTTAHVFDIWFFLEFKFYLHSHSPRHLIFDSLSSSESVSCFNFVWIHKSGVSVCLCEGLNPIEALQRPTWFSFTQDRIVRYLSISSSHPFSQVTKHSSWLCEKSVADPIDT